MNSQMTFLALGVLIGSPDGFELPWASLASMLPRTSPVSPIPMSDRNVRRGTPLHVECVIASPNGYEVVVVEQDEHQVLAGSGVGFFRSGDSIGGLAKRLKAR